MKQWQKWWLLFTVIWAVVAALQVVTILATTEEPEKAWRPVLMGLGVPLLLYLVGWGWARLKRK